MRPDIFDLEYQFSESGMYHSIPPSKHVEYVEYIKTFPLNPDPEAFGLHQNAEITTAISETRRMLETILLVQPRSSSTAGKSREAMIQGITQDIETRLPPLFDTEEISLRYPTQYEESMNTVLIQEVIRFQRLMEIMKTTLSDVQKALLGKVVMSEELEGMANSLFINQVPKLWSDRGFLSMKPLSSWFSELLERIEFLTQWIDGGTPKIFWVSGFFFPQAFFTGTLQNFARRTKVAIDRLNFDFHILDDRTVAEITKKPEHGCYVYGLWLEGCKWDNQIHKLAPSNPKELYTPLPIVHFLPVIDRVAPKTGVYNCPVYKVLSRAGTLSTTGHSTNFVLFMELPSKDTEDVWIKAGVALFLSLRN
jgi:dynein heavy chain